MKVVALVPMKGHSQRVPNKNMKLFHGKPLYHHVIETLIKSDHILKIIIDTDSDEIINDATNVFQENIQIIKRPKSIQGDFVSMNTIIDYDINCFPDDKHFLQTHSTNPLLSIQTINLAIEKYFSTIDGNKYDSLFSVTRFQTRFYWRSGNPVNHNPEELLRTQDLEALFEENSNLYVFSRDSFHYNNKNRIGKRPLLFEIDKIEATDIDEPIDFLIAEKIFPLCVR